MRLTPFFLGTHVWLTIGTWISQDFSATRLLLAFIVSVPFWYAICTLASLGLRTRLHLYLNSFCGNEVRNNIGLHFRIRDLDCCLDSIRRSRCFNGIQQAGQRFAPTPCQYLHEESFEESFVTPQSFIIFGRYPIKNYYSLIKLFKSSGFN